MTDYTNNEGRVDGNAFPQSAQADADVVATNLPSHRYNLVMFMPDQLRYDSLGYTGNPVISTPNFDALAAAGTRFTSGFSGRGSS